MKKFVGVEGLRLLTVRGVRVDEPLADASGVVVGRGEFPAWMGPSGSGKTTLLNSISGIDSPTGGALVVDNNAISTFSTCQLTSW